MKKLIILFTAILLVSCADNKVIDGKEYRPYGLINEAFCKNDSVHYEVAIDAAISGVLFFEMFFIPTAYTYGYNLWEPVCLKKDLRNNPNKGVTN